jgi:D-glycero-alpha-D-manno-heptose-7-phosphate kinase
MQPPPADRAVAIAVQSAVPAGCGAGTSAAVGVALLGALSALRSESRSPRDVAYAAHSLEVDVLGVESGIQDHLSAAFGGINYIEIDPYPHATVQRQPDWEALSPRLTLVALGRAHDSSAVHREVIEHVAGRNATPVLDRMRDAAVAAREAVVAQDLRAFGAAMIANTEAQRLLHPALVGASATTAITHARHTGAIGWKVNGAGGDGGSVTILHASPDARDAYAAGVVQPFQVLPTRIAAAGLVVDYETG